MFRKAFSLIDQPYKFVHGNLAIDKKGNQVEPTSLKAVAFDMCGSLIAVHRYIPTYEGVECVSYPSKSLEDDVETLTKLAHKAFPQYRNYSLGAINDMMSYDEVLELFGLLFYTT